MKQGQYFRHWKHVPEFLWSLTPSFHPRTDPYLVSPDNGEFYYHIPSMQALQGTRDTLGAPVRINSGRRSELHNAHVGGRPMSQHFMKVAFDIDFHHSGHDPLILKQILLQQGFTGIGLYRTFIHADMGPVRQWYGSRDAKQFWEALQQGKSEVSYTNSYAGQLRSGTTRSGYR